MTWRFRYIMKRSSLLAIEIPYTAMARGFGIYYKIMFSSGFFFVLFLLFTKIFLKSARPIISKQVKPREERNKIASLKFAFFSLLRHNFESLRPRSKVLNISMNNTEHLFSAKCSENLTTLLSFVHPC